MAIKIINNPDVHVTEAELRRYSDEYKHAYSFYSGTPPTLEEFIRGKKSLKENKDTKTLLQG